MIARLIKTVSARLKVGELLKHEQDSAPSASARNASPGADCDQPVNTYVNRDTSDAARRLWCRAGHF